MLCNGEVVENRLSELDPGWPNHTPTSSSRRTWTPDFKPLVNLALWNRSMQQHGNQHIAAHDWVHAQTSWLSSEYASLPEPGDETHALGD